MSSKRFRRRDRRTLRAKYFADGLDLLEVADRSRSRVRIDVIDRSLDTVQRHPHAADGTLPGGRYHVEAIGGGAIAGDLAVDAPATGFGVLEFLQNQHARPAGDDET